MRLTRLETDSRLRARYACHSQSFLTFSLRRAYRKLIGQVMTCMRLSLPPLLLRHQSEMMSAACFFILILAISRDITCIPESSAGVNLQESISLNNELA